MVAALTAYTSNQNNGNHYGMQKDYFSAVLVRDIQAELQVTLNPIIQTGADFYAIVQQVINGFYLGTTGKLPLTNAASLENPMFAAPSGKSASPMQQNFAKAQAHLQTNEAYLNALAGAATSGTTAQYAGMAVSGSALMAFDTQLLTTLPGGAPAVFGILTNLWNLVGVFGLGTVLASITGPQISAVQGVAAVVVGAGFLFYYSYRIWSQIQGYSPGSFDKGNKESDPVYLMRISNRMPLIYPPTWGDKPTPPVEQTGGRCLEGCVG